MSSLTGWLYQRSFLRGWLLRRQARSKDTKASEAAIRQLAADGDVDSLCRLLNGRCTAKWDVAWQLGQMGDARAIGPLMAYMKQYMEYGKWGLTSDPIEAIGNIGHSDAVVPLVNELGSLLDNIRNWIAEFDQSGTPFDDSQHDRFRGEKEFFVRAAAALGKIGDKRAIPVLVDILHSPLHFGDSSHVIREALRRLGWQLPVDKPTGKPLATNSAEDELAAALNRRRYRCPKCKSTTTYGDWERAMDQQAKSQGAKGFVNVNMKPRCLRCNTELVRQN